MDVYKTRWDNSQVFSFELYPAQVYMHPDALYCSVIFLLLSSNENELQLLEIQMLVPRCWWQFFKATRIIKRASVNENTGVLPGDPDGGSTKQ